MPADMGHDRMPASGGRSGNDYLQRGGAGYQSWAAEGPSGAVGTGSLAPDTQLAQGQPTTTGVAPAGPAGGASPLVTLLAGIGIGAAVMYFLDPDRGTRRRHIVADKARSAARDAQGLMRDMAVDTRNRATGRVAELRSRMREEDVTDDQLVARVRAQLGHHVERARPIEVVAESGTVTLRGPVAATELADVVAAVEKVRGVERVENQLQVQAEDPGAPLL